MFGSTGFLIGGKLAIGARSDRIMCRVDPQLDTHLAKEPGCRPVVMKGRTMKGYWYVEEKALRDRAALDRWIALVLQQNRSLPASKKAAAASAPKTRVGSRARKASTARRTR